MTIRIFLVSLGIALSATSAFSSVLRGGEHGDFTRVTLQVADDIKAVDVAVLADRKVRVELDQRLATLDKSRLFDRLSDDRLSDVNLVDGALHLELGCECLVRHSIFEDRLLILDIFDADEDRRDFGVTVGNPFRLTQNPGERARSPFLPFFGQTGSRELNEISKEPISVPTEGRDSLLEGPGFQRGFAYAEGKLTASGLDDDKTEFVCGDRPVAEIVQSLLKLSGEMSMEGTNAFGGNALAAGGEHQVEFAIALLRQGYFEEAIAVMETGDFAVDREMGATDALLQAQMAPKEPTEASCSELLALIDVVRLFTSPAGHLSNDKVRLASAFMSLPPGLQVRLGRRFFQYVGEDFGGFEDLRRHLENEDMRAFLGKDAQAESGQGVNGIDADALAASAIELRDTDLHRNAWDQVFDRYLAEQRFFDATRHLLASAVLMPTDTVELAALLLSAIGENDDTIVLSEVIAILEQGLPPEIFADAMTLVHARLDIDLGPILTSLSAEIGSLQPAGAIDEMEIATTGAEGGVLEDVGSGDADLTQGADSRTSMRVALPDSDLAVSVSEASTLLEEARSTSDALLEAFGQ